MKGSGCNSAKNDNRIEVNSISIQCRFDNFDIDSTSIRHRCNCHFSLGKILAKTPRLQFPLDIPQIIKCLHSDWTVHARVRNHYGVTAQNHADASSYETHIARTCECHMRAGDMSLM